MTPTTQKNEQLKRKFYAWLKSAKGFSDDTVHCHEKAIWLWEDFTQKDDFAHFNMTKAEEFKIWLKNKKKPSSQENISISYCYDMLRFLKFFFGWLAQQTGYKSKINQTAIDYLNLERKEVREAKQSKSVKNPELKEIIQVIESLKGKTEIEMRDRALFSLAFLTGARISAIRTLPLKSFDKKDLILYQDPSLGVDTKFNKKIITYLIPFGYDKALTCFIGWYDYLEKQKGFKPSDPLFPAPKIENGENNISYYNTGEVEPKFFKNSSSLRKIFEKRFKQAGIDYYHPHTFRHFWVKEISKLPLTEKEKKALSQNLGHENVGTTFGNYGYGKLDDYEQIDVIRNIDFENRMENSQNNNINMGDEKLKQLAKLITEGLAKSSNSDKI